MKSRSRRWPILALCALAAAGAAQAAMTESEARRFLDEASFGPTDATVAAAMASSRADWLAQQFTRADSDYAGYTYVNPNPKLGCPAGSAPTCRRDNYSIFPLQRQFFENALGNPDQLRQRVALALSEILVASGRQIHQPYAMANYERIFLADAFTNFRRILRDVTLSPVMGDYLNMANNAKGNPARGTTANENYGREVLQLFSVGLVMLNPDGSAQRDSQGLPVPTYSQDIVEGYSRAFTGWTYPPRPGATAHFGDPVDFESPMIAFAAQHDEAAKTLLGGVTLPAGQTPAADLEGALDSIFNHPNVGPFIGRQLIQQLVTSNPSPAYVARVTAAFDAAPRGDMKRVIRAILLDPEASAPAAPSTYGKLREPVVQLVRLFRALGGRSDGVWLLRQAAALGEPVFSPATVFNFYPPDYALPDDPGLLGPTFGVYNASTAFVLSGALAMALGPNGIAADPTVAGASGSRIDLGPWQGLVADPAGLAAQINRVLFAGAMSPALQSTVAAAAQSQPAAKPLARVRAALFVAAMAPEYLVEH
ncbi:MAG: DUF1800 family protein [Burkholderiales bacterium]|nr:DUF1800 family protein [Burkholderiales bacterium]MDE1926782.1 DUF1800 family protein [Burkholderiales bacterium]MDE2158279.1 DUF1800 family protein [Burkholderiales bacterium]MDE2502255.1 DUF1800 family protein [Burkholderiales bacterium]